MKKQFPRVESLSDSDLTCLKGGYDEPNDWPNDKPNDVNETTIEDEDTPL